ncbi:MAG: beta strand repeat-containing protein [Candidatus Kapaibacterium sp.]
MKKTTIRTAAALLLGILTTLGLSAQERGSSDVPRIITYQGVLSSTTGSHSGEYQITFRLYGDAEGREVIWEGTYATQIDRGLFSADLGSGAFPLPDASKMGRSLWLGVQVGENPEMNPRTLLSASPYALTIPDGSVTAEKIGTEYVSAITINGEKVTGQGTPFNLSGGSGIDLQYDPVTQGVQIGLSNQLVGSSGEKGNQLQAANAAPNGIVTPWSENGNNGTTPGTHFVGTSDQVELEIHVNASNTSTTSGDRRVMLFDPQTNSPNLIGGFQGNLPGQGTAIEGATIGGGGRSGSINNVRDDFGTIGGGDNNVVGGASTATTSDDAYATVSGGQSNQAVANHSTVGGGQGNQAQANHATIGGGEVNRTQANHATIGGGQLNTTSTLANHATIGGGNTNTVSMSAANATIGGGQQNNTIDSWGTIGGGMENQTGHIGTFAGGGPINADYATVGGGQNNTSRGSYASIGGGQDNNVTDDYGTIGGGFTNQAGNNNSVGGAIPLGTLTDAQYATVGGGRDNTASGPESTVGGGNDNLAQGFRSTVSGGFVNEVFAARGTIGGGDNNKVYAQTGTISGGQDNLVGTLTTTTGSNGAIGGGMTNLVDADFGTIAGGENNNVYDEHGSVGGGEGNSVGTNNANGTDATHATIGGGELNTASSTHTTVGGGESNAASDEYATVSGGFDNTANGKYGTVGGGNTNVAAGEAATVGGGKDNSAATHFSTVGGGENNSIVDHYGTIGGGKDNFVGYPNESPANPTTQQFATVSGGHNNNAAGPASAIAGGRYLTVGDNSFGFNGDDATTPTQTDVSNYSQTAYFGNVDLWIGNVDNSPRELRFFEGSTNHTYTGTSSTIPHYIALKAPTTMTQSTSHADNGHTIYTLPGQYPSSNGEFLTSTAGGTMSWASLNGQAWQLKGNSSTTPGTGAGQHYLGTSDANALILATNATTRITIASGGAVTVSGSLTTNNGLTVSNGTTINGSLALGTGTPISLNGSQGSADQVLTSSGTNATPQWKSISELAIGDAWLQGGNSNVGTGDYFGTSNAVDLSIRTNGTERIGISSAGITTVTGSLQLATGTTLKVSNSTGSADQVLTSQGSNSPEWKSLSAIVGSWNPSGNNQTTGKLGIGIASSASPAVTVDVNGGVAVQPGTNATVNATQVTVTVGDRSFIRVASTGTPTNRELCLSDGLQDGQVLIVLCLGDNGDNYRGTNGFKIKSRTNVRLSGDANRDMQKFDMLTLVWDSDARYDSDDSNTATGRWIQQSFSGN